MDINSTVKKTIKGVLQAGGLHVRRLRNADLDPFRWFTDFGIKTILDVGANEGQFAEEIRRVFPNAFIYSFEPLNDAYERLRDQFAHDCNFRAFNFALGNQEGHATIHHNKFSQSSSVLPMAQLHRDAFPGTSEDSEETIEIKRLDSVATSEKLNLLRPLLVKLDVQGFEVEVIRGGRQAIAGADVVISEVSYVELYEGQPLVGDVIREMEAIGFKFSCISDMRTHPETNRPLYGDAVFVRA